MREIIYQELINDGELADMGFSEANVFPNYGWETLPRDKVFLIIRFAEQEIISGHIGRGPEVVEVWAHMPKEFGSDIASLRDTLLVVKDIVLGLEGAKGYGYEITSVGFDGLGGDLSDPGYNTFTKNISFRILSHPVG